MHAEGSEQPPQAKGMHMSATDSDKARYPKADEDNDVAGHLLRDSEMRDVKGRLRNSEDHDMRATDGDDDVEGHLR